jgi:DNA-binding response OmpR family regulator
MPDLVLMDIMLPDLDGFSTAADPGEQQRPSDHLTAKGRRRPDLT